MISLSPLATWSVLSVVLALSVAGLLFALKRSPGGTR